MQIVKRSKVFFTFISIFLLSSFRPLWSIPLPPSHSYGLRIHDYDEKDYDILGNPQDDVYVTKWFDFDAGNLNEEIEGEISLFKNPGPNDFVVPFYYYKAKQYWDDGRHTPAPLVVISPSLQGVTFVDRYIAQQFAENGINCIIFNPNIELKDLSRPLEDVDSYFRLALFSVKMLLDWAENQHDEIDMTKVGVFGMSLGGMISAMALGQDSRLKAGYLVVAGGDLPSVLTHSGSSYLTEYRQLHMEKRKINTLEQYEKALRKIITIDPTHVSIQRNPESIYMVMSRTDNVVPYNNQNILWEALNQPNYSVNNVFGHILTAVTMTWYAQSIVDHMLINWN
jgi:hypothetical protein